MKQENKHVLGRVRVETLFGPEHIIGSMCLKQTRSPLTQTQTLFTQTHYWPSRRDDCAFSGRRLRRRRRHRRCCRRCRHRGRVDLARVLSTSNGSFVPTSARHRLSCVFFLFFCSACACYGCSLFGLLDYCTWWWTCFSAWVFRCSAHACLESKGGWALGFCFLFVSVISFISIVVCRRWFCFLPCVDSATSNLHVVLRFFLLICFLLLWVTRLCAVFMEIAESAPTSCVSLAFRAVGWALGSDFGLDYARHVVGFDKAS